MQKYRRDMWLRFLIHTHMPDEYLCWSPFFSLLTVLGACKNKLNLNTSLHMTSVGFQDTQAWDPPSEFLHVPN